MPNDPIVSLIDAEISKLKQARVLLAKTGKVEAKITAHIAKVAKVKAKALKTKVVKTKAAKVAKVTCLAVVFQLCTDPARGSK